MGKNLANLTDFKEVAGFPQYAVSKRGDVYSYRSKRLLSPHKRSDGYLSVGLTGGECRHKCLYVHRLVALAFVENPQELSTVNHIDGDKANNSYDNLEWCSQCENVRHAVDTGLFHNGERTGNSKLKTGDIPIIRKLREQGETQARIAEMFKVERTAVRAVLDGVTWRHVV